MKYNLNGKYMQLLEKVTERYKNEGFLPGDNVKIKKNALNNEYFKNKATQFTELITNLIKDGASLKISMIKSGGGTNFGSDLAGNADGCDKFADLYREHAPGMWSCPMTLPLDVLEKIEKNSEAEGFAPIDDKLNYNAKLVHKPIEADEFEWGEPVEKKKESKKKKASDKK